MTLKKSRKRGEINTNGILIILKNEILACLISLPPEYRIVQVSLQQSRAPGHDETAATGNHHQPRRIYKLTVKGSLISKAFLSFPSLAFMPGLPPSTKTHYLPKVLYDPGVCGCY